MRTSKPTAQPPVVEHPGAGPELAADKSRRGFLGVVGAIAAAAGLGLPVVLAARSYVPNVLYEPPRQVKLGPLEAFPNGSTFIAQQRLFVFRDNQTLHCISARCTHLGCTVQLVNLKEAAQGFEFHCPCHGSKFHADGENFAGPAPQPLEYYTLSVAPDDGQLMVDLSSPADKGWRLTV